MGVQFHRNRYKTGRVVPIRNLKVTETKIKEIVEKQKNRDVFAVGRFQMIPATFNDSIKTLNLDENEFLSEEMQDRIFDEYLIDKKRPKIIKYLESDGNIEDAMYAAAQEWASIGVEKGKKISGNRIAEGGESYYAGDGLNKSHISPEKIKTALINSKNKVK